MDLETYAANCARAEAGQPLRFPEAPIQQERPDPLAMADRDVANLLLDLNAMVNRTCAVDEALRLHLLIESWRRALATVELAALSRANTLLDGKD